MGVSGFKDLLVHYGHHVEVVPYCGMGGTANVAIECFDCNEVLIDFDNDEDEEDGGQEKDD